MGRSLQWSTVYTVSWTPWSLPPEVKKGGPQQRRVLRPVSGDDGDSGVGGDGDDVLLLFAPCPPR